MRLCLGDLDQVAAGVVEHRRGHAAQLERLLGEPHAQAAQPLKLGVHVVDGVTGLLVDDLDGLEAQLERLLTDTALRERLGAAARERAAAFTWEASGTRFAAVVERTLAGEPAAEGRPAAQGS